MDLTYKIDDRDYSLPAQLVEKQGLDQEQVNEIKALQLNRHNITETMRKLNKEKNRDELVELYEQWQKNEDTLQQAWGFDLDRTKQRWYNIPHCTCPKLDNAERAGTPYQIIFDSCIFHGKGFQK